MLNGYKTYVVALVAIAAGIYLETNASGTGVELIFLGLTAMGLRHGVGKSQTAAETPRVIVREVEVEVPAKKGTRAKKSK